ncbi:MAG: response regulator transcription factor [Chitinophagaceae bacterium]
MLVFGTQMHLITFLFICIETVVLFYLAIYRLARPDDKNTFLNITLIGLLIFYNLTGGLLPDVNLPGSYLLQMSIAYGTGFITPCYFPYYVHHAFYLEKMKFHAYKGVFIFLITPYIIFVVLFLSTGNIETAKKLLIIPTLYAVWVIFTLIKAVKSKYKSSFKTKDAKEEMAVSFLSLTPWVSLPIIDYFNLGQVVEATTTNAGFLLLLALQLKQHITMVKAEHQQLIESKEKLLGWNEKLLTEVEKRTREIERLSTDKRILEGCKLYQLTNREREIAGLICRGNSYKQIAESLFIAERTVTKHVQNIFDKVEVSNKLELLNKLTIVHVN